MKKVIITLILVTILALSGCGSNNATPAVSSPSESSTTTSADIDESALPTDAQETSNSEWKEFLRQYEEWVDDYVELVKKYTNNPTDLSILSDYMESMQKMIEWSDQADKIESDLSGDDLKEYLDTISRIIEKLSTIL